MLVIYNPKAGNSEGARVGKLVEQELMNKGIDYTCHASLSREELMEFIEKNALFYSKIVVIGGDGTIRDAISAMNNINWPCPMGIIPAGSGNDLARFLGKNIDPVRLINNYLTFEEEERIYGAYCNDKSFINVLGAGINTSILRKRNALKKIFGRKLSYPIASLIAMLFYRPKYYKLSVDGRDLSGKYFIITVCNGKYFGAGMKISPHSDLHSEELGLIALKKVNKFKLIKAFLNIYKGKHINLSYVDHLMAKEIRIKFETDEEYIDLDGDLFSTREIVVSKTSTKCIRILKHD